MAVILVTVFWKTVVKNVIMMDVTDVKYPPGDRRIYYTLLLLHYRMTSMSQVAQTFTDQISPPAGHHYGCTSIGLQGSASPGCNRG